MGLSPAPRKQWPRLVGATLIGTGLLGIALSLAGLLFVAIAGAGAQQALTRQIATLDQALVATADGLAIAEGSVSDAEAALGSLSTALVNATRAISDTQPTLDALQDLTGSTLPQTIDSTRQALASAEATARVADNVLGALSFLGLRYNPEVPLSDSIGQVSASLADVPAELSEVATGIATARASLEELTGDLEAVADDVDAIEESVSDSAEVVAQYQQVVGTLRAEIASVRETAPFWLGAARWGLFLLLVWLALAQLSLLAHGYELLGRAALIDAVPTVDELDPQRKDPFLDQR
jgi:septal ring factor EnvC (AmiA/AmiB activator)